MTEDSLSKSAELQDRLTEAHEQHQELIKKLQSAEEAKRKMKYELQQVQMKVRREGGRVTNLCSDIVCILLYFINHSICGYSLMTVPVLERSQML